MSYLFEKSILRVSNQMLCSLLLSKWIKRQVDLRLFCHCSRTQVTLRKATCWVPQIAISSEQYLCLCKAEYFTVIQSFKKLKVIPEIVFTRSKVFRIVSEHCLSPLAKLPKLPASRSPTWLCWLKRHIVTRNLFSIGFCFWFPYDEMDLFGLLIIIRLKCWTVLSIQFLKQSSNLILIAE